MAKGVPPPDLNPAPDGFEGGVPASPLRHRHSFQAFPDSRDPVADPSLRPPVPVQDAVKVEMDYFVGEKIEADKGQVPSSRRRRLVLLFATVIVLLCLIIGLSAGLATRSTVTTKYAAAARASTATDNALASASSVSAKSVSVKSAIKASKALKVSASKHSTSTSKPPVTTAQSTSKPATAAAHVKSSAFIKAVSSSRASRTSSVFTLSSSHAYSASTPAFTLVSVNGAASPGSSGNGGSSGSSGLSGLSSNIPTPTPTIVYGTYTAALLARSSSMTRAALPTLAMPAQPLATAGAIRLIESQWNYVGGLTTPSFVTFEQDPFVGNQSVMVVEYPVGSEGGGGTGTKGGIESLMLGVFGNVTQQRSIISYKVAFSEGFDFVNGGKLPGVYGGNGTCSGGIRNTGCFSARLMWRSGGVGEVYCYLPEYNGLSTDALVGGNTTLTKRAFGLSLNTASWNFTTTGWNEIIQVVVLNSNPGPVGPADGYLAIYHNGYLAFERSDLVFRTDPTVGIDSLFFSTFFGGSGSSFWASKGGKSYFKDFEFFGGLKASETFGPNVTATFPANQR